MQISSAFPSKYIRSHDLEGEEVKVIISNVVLEQVMDDQLPVMYFRGWQKGMVLNRGNGKTLALAFGEETDKWRGKEVILYSVMTQFKGEPMQGLRVKASPKDIINDDFPDNLKFDSKGNASRIQPDLVSGAAYSANPHPETPEERLSREGLAMARAGTKSFRSWRDALTLEEYSCDAVTKHLREWTTIANDADRQKGLDQ